ncbi:MAG TPA: hypothetical protein PJ982_07430, partial [Lacipirellulaceae bacterium]|nr:hypothetical protein [Lacipirellulaceae bacterium]
MGHAARGAASKSNANLQSAQQVNESLNALADQRALVCRSSFETDLHIATRQSSQFWCEWGDLARGKTPH